MHSLPFKNKFYIGQVVWHLELAEPKNHTFTPVPCRIKQVMVIDNKLTYLLTTIGEIYKSDLPEQLINGVTEDTLFDSLESCHQTLNKRFPDWRSGFKFCLLDKTESEPESESVRQNKFYIGQLLWWTYPHNRTRNRDYSIPLPIEITALHWKDRFSLVYEVEVTEELRDELLDEDVLREEYDSKLMAWEDELYLTQIKVLEAHLDDKLKEKQYLIDSSSYDLKRLEKLIGHIPEKYKVFTKD